MKLILGSQSKFRKRVMEDLGLEFEVMVSGIDEKAIRFDDPKQLTLALGIAKSDALLPKINEPALLITSDQVVYCGGRIFEKPENAEEIKEFLKFYPKHPPMQTVTSVVVTNTATKERRSAVDVVNVYFKEIPDEVLEKWAQLDEPYKKAGAFSVDNELIKPYIDRFEGEIESIRGLPKSLLLNFLNSNK